MKLRSRKVAMYFGLALVMLLMPIIPVSFTASTTNEANGTGAYSDTVERTASYVENAKYMSAVSGQEEDTQEHNLFYGKAIPSVNANLYIEVKQDADDTAAVAGKLYGYNIADVLEQNGEWTKISSGNLIGYVKTAQLCYDDEAQAVATNAITVAASVTTDNVPVYASITDTATPLSTYAAGTAVTPVSFMGNYLVIKLENGMHAYILKSNVTINYGLQFGMTVKEEQDKIAAEAARVKAEEAAKAAEAARVKAEEEAKAAAKAKAEALKQQVIQHTKDGTDFTYNPTMTVSDDDIWLMACVIDWESGYQTYEGKLAVANIILNRVRSARYGNTISSVVYARSQFTGVADSSGKPSSKFAARLASGPRSTDCVKAAMQALSGVNNVGNYTSFLTTATANYSAYSDYIVIGDHCFY